MSMYETLVATTKLNELRSELARHQRDFSEISDLCQQWVERDIDPVTALRRIRNIVG